MPRAGRIGILGGTFDPVHLGHLLLAEEARQQLCLDKVLFIPAALPPHKTRHKLANASQRYGMVKLAVSTNPYFAVSDIELRRKGPSYSIETVKKLRSLYPGKKLFFLVGSDFLSEFSTWKSIEELRKLCTFVVAPRPGYAGARLPKDMQGLKIKALEISSRDIRARLKHKQSIRYLVPENVRRYILTRRLYIA